MHWRENVDESPGLDRGCAMSGVRRREEAVARRQTLRPTRDRDVEHAAFYVTALQMRMAVFNALRAGFEGDANHHDSLCIAEHLSPNAWTSFLQTGGPSPWRTAGVRRSCRLFEPGERQKIWKGAFPVCIYYKPLKSHKTAKEFFGNPWRKQADIWKCLEKSLEVSRRSGAPLRGRSRCSGRNADRPPFVGQPRISQPISFPPRPTAASSPLTSSPPGPYLPQQ
jgi:hypothetical protein